MNSDRVNTRAFVRCIKVRGLFGSLDYDLELDKGPEERLALFYGDNGCGKTTVLKLLYHLLAPVHGRGHKSVLLHTRFSSFEVFLNGGVTVSALRRQGKTMGSVTFRFQAPRSKSIEVTVKTDEEGTLGQFGPKSEGKLLEFLEALQGLEVELFFMRDNRRITSSRDENFAEDSSSGGDRIQLAMGRAAHAEAMQHSKLVEAIANLHQYFNQLTLTARSVGEDDSNKIYKQIVNHLARPRAKPNAVSAVDFEQLPERLIALGERNRDFERYGFTSPLNVERTVANLRKCPLATRAALLSVLTPYVEGLEARLGALAPIQTLVGEFVGTLNSFLGGSKSIEFSIKDGLTITGYTKESLSPDLLSSGERQLLTLLCHLLPARRTAAIFMIDEPELSLNVKWQRRLLDSLLSFTKGASIQLVMATHSVEMITPHRTEVVRFKPIDSMSKRRSFSAA